MFRFSGVYILPDSQSLERDKNSAEKTGEKFSLLEGVKRGKEEKREKIKKGKWRNLKREERKKDLCKKGKIE